MARIVLPALAPIGLPLAYLMGLAAYPAVLNGLHGDTSFENLVHIGSRSLFGLGVLVFLATLRQTTLSPHPDGVVHATRWSRQLIKRDRISGVTADTSTLMLRLVEPADSLAVVPEDLASQAHRWDEGAPTLAQVKATIESWLRYPPAQPRLPGPVRRWTVATPPAAMLMVGAVGAFLVTRLGG